MHSFSGRLKIGWLCGVILISINCFADSTTNDLAKKIKDIEKRSNGIVGVTAIHIERNKVIAHNSDKRFFMASTIKVPIAMAFLKKVDDKKDSLNRVIKMDYHNSVPGSGTLHYIFEKKNLNMSMQQLIRHMLIYSDNSASDTVLKAASGPRAVNKHLSTLGLKKMSVNRSILEMLMDSNHVDHSLLKQRRPVFSWKQIFNKVPLQKKVLAWQNFQKDRRDTTTPNEMARLLVKLYKKQALSATNTNFLIGVMEQCKTGNSRIRGLLPNYVRVAHKTGTWGIDEPSYIRYPGAKDLFRFVSDVGIITLPHNKGHIAIAVYVKSKAANNYTRNRAIAQASRAIYDHFMRA